MRQYDASYRTPVCKSHKHTHNTSANFNAQRHLLNTAYIGLPALSATDTAAGSERNDPMTELSKQL